MSAGSPGDAVPTAVEATPTAVVYDDRTAQGDYANIEGIFSRRVRELQSIQEVLAELRTLLAAGSLKPAVQRLGEELRSRPSSQHGAAKRNLAADNIRLMLARSGDQHDSLAKEAANLVALFERIEIVARQHSRRRQ
jgi:hypothetical protein